ncbi:hypothetical protein Tco_1330039 [Tanacetum coccineum]
MAALQYKDDHNRIAFLGRERGSEDFTDILSYLDHSPLRYALTHDPPVVFDSLVKQFWATATVRPNAAGSHDLVATIDGREVVVTESLIRAQLQLDDANGIFDMQIDDIFAGMGAIGYPPGGRGNTFVTTHACHCSWLGDVLMSQMLLPIEALVEQLRAHHATSLTLRPMANLFLCLYPPTPPATDFEIDEPLVVWPCPKPAWDRTRYLCPLPKALPTILRLRTVIISIPWKMIPFLGGFHEETHAGPDDAHNQPQPMSLGEGKRYPALLTSLSAKLDRCMGRIDLLETELGTSKKIMGGAIFDALLSLVKKLERTLKLLFLEDIDEREEEEGMAPVPDWRSLTEFSLQRIAQASQRPRIRTRQVRGWIQQLQARIWLRQTASLSLSSVRDELYEILLRMTDTDCNPADDPDFCWCTTVDSLLASTVPTSAQCIMLLLDMKLEFLHFRSDIVLAPPVDDNPQLLRVSRDDDIEDNPIGTKNIFLPKRVGCLSCQSRGSPSLRRRMNRMMCRFFGEHKRMGCEWMEDYIPECFRMAFVNPMGVLPLLLSLHRARQMVFNSPWLTAEKEFGSPLQTALVCNSNPLIALLLRDVAASFDSAVHDRRSCCFHLMLLCLRLVTAACVLAASLLFPSLCFSILLLREDLSRNLELTESTPSLGEDCWDKLQTTKCRFCC